MTLSPLTEPADIDAAVQVVWDNIRPGAEPVENTIGYQGGSFRHTVYWYAHLHMWTILSPMLTVNQFWFAFGNQDPNLHRSLSITCEINIPREGFNRRIAGAFARDHQGNIYLTHSGNLRGGRQGVGRTSFVAFYPGDNRETIFWPDNKTTEVIVIGQIYDPQLLGKIKCFVDQADAFKEAATTGQTQKASNAAAPSFTPEFSGVRESYVLETTIAARCDHGPVMSALRAALKSRNLEAFNDMYRDLYLLAPDRTVSFLFEAKTDMTTYSVYTGLGQLMYHSAAQAKLPKRILVLPGTPNSATVDVLSRLGVIVLPYEWREDILTFPTLNDIL